MKIDPSIFLSTNEVSTDGYEPLSDALAKTAKRADKIIILSAYFGPIFIVNFLSCVPVTRRKKCAVSLVFGLETPSRLGHAVASLRTLRVSIIAMGFRDPEIRIYHKSVPFHVKLFYFKCTTQHHWYVGSANASTAIYGDRHEMMVRLSGRHDAMFEYMNAILDTSVSVQAEKSFSKNVGDLRSFFLRGALCFKPTTQLPLTFEACTIEDKHRQLLQKLVANTTAVPHSDPKTSGFSFNLARAVGSLNRKKFETLEEDRDIAAGRLRYKSKAIETVYGYWVPDVYAEELRDELAELDTEKVQKVIRFSEACSSVRYPLLLNELHKHVEGLVAFFRTNRLSIKVKEDYPDRFRQFFNNRLSLIQDEERVSRLVRRLHIEDMPDIWSDEPAASAFERSFFEDLEMRLEGNSRHAVVRSFLKFLGHIAIERHGSVANALGARLKKGISANAWDQMWLQ